MVFVTEMVIMNLPDRLRLGQPPLNKTLRHYHSTHLYQCCWDLMHGSQWLMCSCYSCWLQYQHLVGLLVRRLMLLTMVVAWTMKNQRRRLWKWEVVHGNEDSCCYCCCWQWWWWWWCWWWWWWWERYSSLKLPEIVEEVDVKHWPSLNRWSWEFVEHREMNPDHHCQRLHNDWSGQSWSCWSYWWC